QGFAPIQFKLVINLTTANHELLRDDGAQPPDAPLTEVKPSATDPSWAHVWPHAGKFGRVKPNAVGVAASPPIVDHHIGALCPADSWRPPTNAAIRSGACGSLSSRAWSTPTRRTRSACCARATARSDCLRATARPVGGLMASGSPMLDMKRLGPWGRPELF